VTWTSLVAVRRPTGTGALFVRCDVSDPEQNSAAVAVKEYGGLDMAFLNAGVATWTGVGESFDLANYRRAMGTNLDGVVFGINAVLPAMKVRGGGSIVATASLAGLAPVPMDPIYSANKHAVVGLVRSLGSVLAGEGIRINAVCPGLADTAIIRRSGSTSQIKGCRSSQSSGLRTP
jgi:NAD(P)-dependent dehydrogenase (short-subunit alcohol dehydrogenase family)